MFAFMNRDKSLCLSFSLSSWALANCSKKRSSRVDCLDQSSDAGDEEQMRQWMLEKTGGSQLPLTHVTSMRVVQRCRDAQQRSPVVTWLPAVSAMLELTSLEADSWHSVALIIFFLVDDWLLELFAVGTICCSISAQQAVGCEVGVSHSWHQWAGKAGRRLGCWVRGGGEMERADIPPQGD